jgi:hypothetical protein
LRYKRCAFTSKTFLTHKQRANETEKSLRDARAPNERQLANFDRCAARCCALRRATHLYVITSLEMSIGAARDDHDVWRELLRRGGVGDD